MHGRLHDNEGVTMDAFSLQKKKIVMRGKYNILIMQDCVYGCTEVERIYKAAIHGEPYKGFIPTIHFILGFSFPTNVVGSVYKYFEVYSSNT